jgi:hypothetical protein
MSLPEPPAMGVSDESPALSHRCVRVGCLVMLFLLAWAVAAYLVLPFAWRWIARHHSALQDAPRITLTRNGIPGDPINIALVGTEEEVMAVMLKADWFPADPITLRNSLRIVSGTVRSRPYETAPVSDLFAWGRRQDLAFQQPIGNNPRRRHHVRFWRSHDLDDSGRPLWVGAATLDTRVGFSRTTGQVTHRIDADVDAERDKLLKDLARGRLLSGIDWIDGFHTQLAGRNGGGDRWHTDGRLPVVVLRGDALHHDAVPWAKKR